MGRLLLERSGRALNRIGIEAMTLLYIDDDREDREFLVEASQTFSPNLRVITAASASQGLEIIQKEPVDVIVVDYKMPEMDGSVFLERVAEKRKGAKVYMYSTFMTDADKEKCRQLGAEDCFQKPSTFNEVGAWLASIASR